MRSKKWMNRNSESNDIEITEPEINFKRPSFIAAKVFFLNFVTILGSARKGKSTLMNCIIGKNVFKTSDDTDGCTQGVCLSEFDVIEETSGNGVVAYVDTEGQGTELMDNEVKLFTPVVFLSKVIIFNVMGAITSLELLEKLNVFLHIGEHLKLKHDGPFKLGHLIIVLRDYNLNETEEEACHRFFTRENTEEESAKEKNEIREQLRSLFESYEVFFFPKPLTEMKMNYDNLTERANALKTKIRNKVREPRKFGGSTYLTPDNVSTFTGHLVDHVNKEVDEAFRMESVVRLVQDEELDLACKRYKNCFLTSLYGLYIPGSGDSDENGLTSKKDELLKQFDEDLSKADFVKKSKLKNKKKNLESFFNTRQTVVKEDKELLRQEITKVETQTENELKEKFRQISLPYKREVIKNELDREIESALRKFCDIDTMLFIDDREKTQILEELEKFCGEKKKEKIKENDEQLQEREVIDEATTTFEDGLKKEIANLQLPKDGIVGFLQRIKTKLFKEFSKSINGVQLEVDYKNDETTELVNDTEKRINDTVERNDKAKASGVSSWIMAIAVVVSAGASGYWVTCNG